MQKKISIVVADDNQSIRETLKDILSEKGYFVEVVSNGYELLYYLKEKSPDIIILDLMMPEKDGIEPFFCIKTISAKSKIIIYTGFQRYKDSIYARIADRFLLKGDTLEELLESVEELS
ncbi:MAG: response regulator [Candidatus Omnitrophica bacterium]|nr:response regulator [Candidatus Omnitrophota bacterium]MCK5493237.1 response regulator [Candidatus Omnitrophota bacterium]